MSSLLNYRKCDLSDLEVLVEVSRSTFEEAFSKHNDPVHIQNYLEKAFSTKQVKEELSNPKSLFYFVEQEGVVVGYLKLNLAGAQTDLNEEGTIELERIYVLAEHQNKGFGKDILYKAIALSRFLGQHSIWLGVWERNDGAIRFYERHNFIRFAEHPFYMGDELQTDFLMKLELRNQ